MSDVFDKSITEDELYQMMMGEAAKESGGGTVALVTVEMGYKVFAVGYTVHDTWFPYKPIPGDADNPEKDAAKEKAKVLGKKADCRYAFGANTIIHLDGAITRGEPATWQDDRHEFVPGYADAFSSLVIKNLVENGIRGMPWTGWARVAWVDDPYFTKQGEAGLETRDDGTTAFPTVAVVAEVYESQDAAYAAVGYEDSDTAPVEESGWQPTGDGWSAVDLLTIKEEVLEGLQAESIDAVCASYGIAPTDVLVLAGVHNSKTPMKTTADEFGVPVAVVKQVRGFEDVPADFG